MTVGILPSPIYPRSTVSAVHGVSSLERSFAPPRVWLWREMEGNGSPRFRILLRLAISPSPPRHALHKLHSTRFLGRTLRSLTHFGAVSLTKEHPSLYAWR